MEHLRRKSRAQWYYVVQRSWIRFEERVKRLGVEPDDERFYSRRQ